MAAGGAGGAGEIGCVSAVGVAHCDGGTGGAGGTGGSNFRVAAVLKAAPHVKAKLVQQLQPAYGAGGDADGGNAVAGGAGAPVPAVWRRRRPCVRRDGGLGGVACLEPFAGPTTMLAPGAMRNLK